MPSSSLDAIACSLLISADVRVSQFISLLAIAGSRCISFTKFLGVASIPTAVNHIAAGILPLNKY